ncbi:hypothetical protein HPB49_019903 [Dermacentor silvarum]|uniref:Uncharacterized protein n=1 Tax=Dermacentor silvarum TaxID=543639 RepID=A0ACB8DQ70_DERSI|nr:hypothetical protein HPB49_019903 [Dermacentor silvarum]
MPKTTGCASLAHALCQMSSRLECLNVTLLALDHAAGDSLADGLRSRSNLRRLVLGDMPNRVARKVFGALGASESLRSLEVSTAEPLTKAHSALLKAALRCNTTLRDLTVRNLDIDTVGIILECLASNDTLKELSFEDSYYRSRFSLPDGLRVLHANSSLSCLKLTNVGVTNRCAFVLADVLRANDALQELSLRKNRISDLGAVALAKVLEQNFSLKYLDLREGKFSCRAVSQFVQGLTRNRTVVCVRLGNVQIDEDWEPPLPLTGDIFLRIQVTWNPCRIEEWTSCLQRQDQYCPSACVRWYSEDYTEPIKQWLSAVDTSRSSLTELVVYFPFRMRDTEAVTEFVSFVEEANSLKKLILHPLGNTCACPTEIITSVARNKSLREAEFHVTLSTYRDVKALQTVLKANRTLHRLKFRCNKLPQEAPRMLARSLEGNFVFLALEFDSYYAQEHMYPLLSALNRNRTLLNSAVRRVLYGTADDCSMRALQFLSASDSLLDAVISASGMTRNQCKCLILEAVSHAECCPRMV